MPPRANPNASNGLPNPPLTKTQLLRQAQNARQREKYLQRLQAQSSQPSSIAPPSALTAAHSSSTTPLPTSIPATESLSEPGIPTPTCEASFSASFPLDSSLPERSKEDRSDRSPTHESNDSQAATPHLTINASSTKSPSSPNPNRHALDFSSASPLPSAPKRRGRPPKNTRKAVPNDAKPPFTTLPEPPVSSTEVSSKPRGRPRKAFNPSHATAPKPRGRPRKTPETTQGTKSNTPPRHQSKRAILSRSVAPKSLKRQSRHRNNSRSSSRGTRPSTSFRSQSESSPSLSPETRNDHIQSPKQTLPHRKRVPATSNDRPNSIPQSLSSAITYQGLIEDLQSTLLSIQLSILFTLFY